VLWFGHRPVQTSRTAEAVGRPLQAVEDCWSTGCQSWIPPEHILDLRARAPAAHAEAAATVIPALLLTLLVEAIGLVGLTILVAVPWFGITSPIGHAATTTANRSAYNYDSAVTFVQSGVRPPYLVQGVRGSSPALG
jgi:hypothetical protein